MTLSRRAPPGISQSTSLASALIGDAAADRLRAAGMIGGVEHDLVVEAAARARTDAEARRGAIRRAEAALAGAMGRPRMALADV